MDHYFKEASLLETSLPNFCSLPLQQGTYMQHGHNTGDEERCLSVNEVSVVIEMVRTALGGGCSRVWLL